LRTKMVNWPLMVPSGSGPSPRQWFTEVYQTKIATHCRDGFLKRFQWVSGQLQTQKPAGAVP